MVMRPLEIRLPPEVFAAAIARSRSCQVDEVVAELIWDRPASGQALLAGG
jgi:hypothetical protein